MSIVTPEIDVVAKLLVAALLGACIGIERELKHKPIGLRTNVLIAMTGACLMLLTTNASRLFPSQDAPQLATALIQGLGFLGAGAIIHGRSSVSGLSTAAALLIVAGIGLAVGAGAWTLAVASTIFTLLIMTTFRAIERRLHSRCQTTNYSVATTDPASLVVEVDRVLSDYKTHVHEMQISAEGDRQRIEFAVCHSTELNQSLLTTVLASKHELNVGK